MKYSSLFTHPSQPPINRAFPRGEELAQLFTTLHHSSPGAPLFLLEFNELISLPLLGMLHLATHQLERLTDANLGAQITHQHRIMLMQHLENLRAVHPLSLIFFLPFRNPEAVAYHRFQVVRLEERQGLLLDASHLVIGEPIRGLLMAKLIHNLCIELVIIDDRTIVYIPERSLNHFRSSSQMIRFL